MSVVASGMEMGDFYLAKPLCILEPSRLCASLWGIARSPLGTGAVFLRRPTFGDRIPNADYISGSKEGFRRV